MKKEQIYVGITLFILGFIGVLSLLTMKQTFPEEIEKQLATIPSEIRPFLILINPTILLFISTILGTTLCQKVNLSTPLIENLFAPEKRNIDIKGICISGVSYGTLAGILLLLITTLSTHVLSEELKALGANIQPSLLNRFLYGGFTEEIMIRFGAMTFIVFIGSLILKKLSNSLYWIAIIVSALLFAVGHLPIVFMTNPSPSIGLISYIIIGNTTGGLIFGYLYWKKGLEAAFIAHIFAHVAMVLGEMVFT